MVDGFMCKNRKYIYSKKIYYNINTNKYVSSGYVENGVNKGVN